MTAPSANTYVFCHPSGGHAEFDLGTPGRFGFDDAYFAAALRHMERLGVRGYTIVFAYDSAVPLPRTGTDVVVILYGDERRRVPPYLGAVAAVFTVFGLAPVAGGAPLLSRQGIIEAVDLARRAVPWLPGAARRLAARLRGRHEAPVHLIPMGYQKLVDLPLKPLARRRYASSFVGSVGAGMPPSLTRVLGTPKLASRRALVAVLAQMRSRFPVELDITGGYQESLARGPERYSEVLMDTMICPVPRGTTPESARYFAAAKFGCILVAERQPDAWFLRGSPAITVGTWRELPGIVEALLADPGQMEALHRRTLDWWEQTCSEEALGRFLAARLPASPQAATPMIPPTSGRRSAEPGRADGTS